jgi:hypothetical protein
MKQKRLFILIFAFLAIGISSCSKLIYQSVWQTDTIKADGIVDEWSKPLRFYDGTTKLQYAFTNDKKNLYLCIRATDETTQKKIMSGGMQIWIDTTGNGKEKTGVFFPLPINVDKSDGMPDVKKTDEQDEYKPKLLRVSRNEMQLTGFKAPIGGTVPLHNMDGIAVNIQMDKDEILNYEAIIPFRTFFRDSLQLTDTARVMSLKINVNGMPQPHKKDKDGSENNDAAQSMGSRAGSMGSPGGGGRGGAKGGMAPANPMSESHTLTTRFKLVIK